MAYRLLQCLKKQDKKVDAIILDIIMPEMDGYEFMDKIKQDKNLISDTCYYTNRKIRQRH